MPRKGTTKKQKVQAEEQAKKETGLFAYLRFGESYTSLILGIIVVIIATALLLSFVHNKNATHVNSSISEQNPNTVQITQQANTIAQKGPSPTITPKPTITKKVKKIGKNSSVKQALISKNIWIVQKNDSLWSIAEKKYTSGYNWVDIAKANNLADPSNIHVGDRLVLPKVLPKESTLVAATPTVNTNDQQNYTIKASNPILNKEYTIAKGDTLWDIAVRAYGDGYKWTAIAKANNLANPGLIHSGNHLIIPR